MANNRKIPAMMELIVPNSAYPKNPEEATDLSKAIVTSVNRTVKKQLGIKDKLAVVRSFGMGLSSEAAPKKSQMLDTQTGEVVDTQYPPHPPRNEHLYGEQPTKYGPKKVKGREDLDRDVGQPCSCGEVHHQDLHIMAAGCHPRGSFEVAYHVSGMLMIKCSVCDSIVEYIAVAPKGGDAIEYIRPSSPVQ